MSLGEAFISGFLKVLLQRLTSRETLSYFRSLLGVGKELDKRNSMLSDIRAVLNDAEDKQLTSQAVKLWLDGLRYLAYDVEDILDKFSTEMLRRQIKEKHWATTSKVWWLFSDVKFNCNMNSEIKKITGRIHEISERKNQLGLNVVTSSTKAWHMPPSSYLPEGPVIGRDADKRKITDLLLKEAPPIVNFHVVGIVGMPGVGKITLARHVFCDDAMKDFNPKVWVSVWDDFNLERVTKAILESATSGPMDEFKEFNKVQESLSKELSGKKFLIVLDDVWNICVYDLWTKLQSLFRVGALGSKIVVTTREPNVAKMMGSTVYQLDCISDDQCWKVFEHHSLLDITNNRPQNFELVKKKIVAKCSGLPLAVRTLGGLLRCKQVEEWEEILNNKMWSLSNNSGILPLLNVVSWHVGLQLKYASHWRIREMMTYNLNYFRWLVMSYVSGEYDGVKKFEAISRVKHLRTFLPFSHSSGNNLTRTVTFDLLPKLRILRVLSLNGYNCQS